MFGIKRKIKQAAIEAAMEFAKSFYEEHLKGQKIMIEPDLKTKSIVIKFTNQGDGYGTSSTPNYSSR